MDILITSHCLALCIALISMVPRTNALIGILLYAVVVFLFFC